MLDEARKKRAKPYEAPPGPPLTKKDLEEIKRLKQDLGLSRRPRGEIRQELSGKEILHRMRQMPVLKHGQESAIPDTEGDIDFRRRDINQPDQPRQLAVSFSGDWDGGAIEITGRDARGRLRSRKNPWVVNPVPGKTVIVNKGNPLREIRSIRNTGALIDIELWDPEKQENVIKKHRDRAEGQVRVFWRMPSPAPFHQEPEKAEEVEDIEDIIQKLSTEQDAARRAGDAARVNQIAQEIERLMRSQKRVWSGEPPSVRPETKKERTHRVLERFASRIEKANKMYEAAVEAGDEESANELEEIIDKLKAAQSEAEAKAKEFPWMDPEAEEEEPAVTSAPGEGGRFSEKTINQFASEIQRQREGFMKLHTAGIEAVEHFLKQENDIERAKAQGEISQSEELTDKRTVKAQTEQVLKKASDAKTAFVNKLLDTMMELKAKAKEDWTAFQVVWNDLSPEQQAEYNAEYGRSQFSYDRMKRNFDNAQQQLDDLIDAFKQAHIREKQPSASLLLNMVRIRMQEQGIEEEPGYEKCPECGYEGSFESAQEKIKPSWPATRAPMVRGMVTSAVGDNVIINVGSNDGVEEGMKFETGDIAIKIDRVMDDSSGGIIVSGDPSMVRRGAIVVGTSPHVTADRVQCPQCGEMFNKEQIMQPGTVYDPDVLGELQKELKLENPDHVPIQTTVVSAAPKSMQFDTGKKTEEGEPLYSTKEVTQIILDAGVQDGMVRGLDFDIEADGVVLGQCEVTEVGSKKSRAILKNGDPATIEQGQVAKTMKPLNIDGWGDMWIPRWRGNATYMGFEPHRGGSGVEPGKGELEAFSYHIDPYDKREVPGRPGEVYAWKPKPDLPYILMLNYLWNIKAIEVGLLSMSRFTRKQPYFSHRPTGQVREKPRGRYRGESIQRGCVICESSPCRCCTKCSSFPCVCEEIQKERIRIISEFFGDA